MPQDYREETEMSTKSIAEQFVLLLEQHWDELKQELGSQWSTFIEAYRDIIELLPPEPDTESVGQITIKLLGLLQKSEPGRRLLRKNSDIQVRLIKSGSETLPDSVPVKQVANRLRDRLKLEENKKKEKEATRARDAKDK